MHTPREEELMRRMVEEQRLAGDFKLPIHLDLSASLCLVAQLQLASRHPGNQDSPSAELARTLIDGIITRTRQAGFVACAELMKLGDDPQHDIRPPERPPCCAHCGAELHSKQDIQNHQCKLIELAHYPD